MGKAVAKAAKAAEWKVRAKLPGLAYFVHALEFSHDGRLLASGAHVTEAWLSDARSGKPLHKLDGYETPCMFAFSPDGRMVAVAEADAAVDVYDVRTGKRLARLEARSTHVSFSPDGKLVAVATGKSSHVWETKSWAQIAKLDGHRSHVTFAEFLARGLLATCAGKEVRVWNVAAATSKAFDHKGDTNYLCTSSDGRYVVSAGYKHHARVWDIRAGKQAAELAEHEDAVFCADISRNGGVIVTGSMDGAVRVWRMPGGELTHTLRSDDEDANSVPVVLSPDAKLVAAQMESVWVWDVASGNLVVKLSAKADEGCLAFSPDGKLLAAGSDDGVVLYEVRAKGK